MNVKFNTVSESLCNKIITLLPIWIELKKLSTYISQRKCINPTFYITYNRTLEELDINGYRGDISFCLMLFGQARYRFLKDECDGKNPPAKYLRETRFIPFGHKLQTAHYQDPETSTLPISQAGANTNGGMAIDNPNGKTFPTTSLYTRIKKQTYLLNYS